MLVPVARRVGCGSARARSGGVCPSRTSPRRSSGARRPIQGRDRPRSAEVGAVPRRRSTWRHLALAAACALGLNPAWEHFVREFRPVLLRVAGGPAGRTAPGTSPTRSTRTCTGWRSATAGGGRCSTTTTAAARWPAGCAPSSRSASSTRCASRGGSSRCRRMRRRRRAGGAGRRAGRRRGPVALLGLVRQALAGASAGLDAEGAAASVALLRGGT